MHVSSPVRIRKVENGGKYGREGRYDETEVLRDLWEEKKLTCGSLPSIRLCVVLIELAKFYTVSTEPADGNDPP